MDPVTLGAVLAAIAAGTGGAIGGQLWAGLTALVRRPFRHPPAPAAGEVVAGQAELAGLEQAPGDQDRALALAEALIARAATDTGFGQDLAGWWQHARQVSTGGTVTNIISGGTQYGPVLQGRDFTGLTFTSPAPPPDPRT
jgi:hypothetical protein